MSIREKKLLLFSRLNSFFWQRQKMKSDFYFSPRIKKVKRKMSDNDIQKQQQEEADVELFKEFLRFNTTHPNPQLRPMCDWLKKRAEELDMKYSERELTPGLPIALLTIEGSDPSLPSLLLNAHMDVVPVVPEMWTALPAGETPFTAWEDEKTHFIYGRGAQDNGRSGRQKSTWRGA